MKIVLVEFSWQVKEIINRRESFKKYVIVSLDPESSYVLKINKIPYFETYHFCEHKELWSRYKEMTDSSLEIAKILDEALWNTDKRFKDLNWKLFDDFHYPLKISFDQLFYYSELISKLIEKFNPTEIMIADSNKILINHEFLLHDKISVIKFLLKTYSNSLKNIKISYAIPNQNEKLKFSSLDFFSIKNIIINKCKDIYYRTNFLINFYLSKPKYLSIGCFEILKYKKLYPNESKFFLLYHHNNANKKKIIGDLTFFYKFIDHLRNETNFNDLIKHKNISFELIFHEILLKVLQQRDFLLDEYRKAKKIVNRIKPTCVIFQHTQPVYFANITFRKVCNEDKIPFAIWMHGGYGLSYSVPNYDITDFRFCKNHISYGHYLKDLIVDNRCILKNFKFIENYNILPVGSPRLDDENSKVKRNNFLKIDNKKKTILFASGLLMRRNQFRFGRDREKYETSTWEFHYDILNLLRKYQDRYNIIFKDYENSHKNLWKKILKDFKTEKILYISNEVKINSLLRLSDLNIIPWISTTFFEALYYDADIFVIEEDLLDKYQELNFKKEIFFFKNTKKFLSELEKYLESGQFYTRAKGNSKNHFLCLDHINKRDKLLNRSLSYIIDNNA